MILDALLDLPFAQIAPGGEFSLFRLSQNAEIEGDRGEEFQWGAEGGIQQQMRFHILSRPVGFGELRDQVAAERRFSRAHAAQHHVQAPAEADGQFEFLETTDMFWGLKEKLRLGGVGEGLFRQVEDLEIVHYLFKGVGSFSTDFPVKGPAVADAV